MTISNSTKIDTIIFDLGAVLIDWNPEYLYRKIFPDEQKMHYFLNNICTPEWNLQQDGGRSWTEATALLLEDHPEYEYEIRSFRDRWPEMLKGAIAGSVELLEELEAQDRYRLLALTNWSAETWPYAWEQFEFLRIFEGILVSGQENLKKPDPEIYQLLIDRFAINPEKSLFIDDNPRNVQSARAMSMHALQFVSPEKLRKTLHEASII